jgi:DNA-binding CsgD family transcriptional regulator
MARPWDSSEQDCLSLTERQVTILCLLAEGLTSAEAADSLHISPHTVAQHVAAMLRKAGARNRGELIARAFVLGLLAPNYWPPTPIISAPIMRLVPAPTPGS